MGWNSVKQIPAGPDPSRGHPIFEGVEDNSEFYFVHSYYPMPAHSTCVLGETQYADVSFASVMGSQNIVATQFHPEKSGRIGLRLLENFSRWSGI
jgi:glutamine amidotransferase